VLLDTVTTLAIRCPECGNLEFHNLSRFALSGGGKIQIKCSCGAFLLGIVRKSPRSYWLQVPCVLCETKHLREISGARLWGKSAITLECHEAGLELGFLGRAEEVKTLAEDLDTDLESLVDQLGFDEYFNNSEVMHQVMQCVQDIADNGGLFCQCGINRIEVDVFLDRLELHCTECDSINIVYAETEEDLRVIQQVETIELVRNGFKCLDSFSNNTKPAKKARRKRNKHS
jgi:ribosomal protein S27E